MFQFFLFIGFDSVISTLPYGFQFCCEDLWVTVSRWILLKVCWCRRALVSCCTGNLSSSHMQTLTSNGTLQSKVRPSFFTQFLCEKYCVAKKSLHGLLVVFPLKKFTSKSFFAFSDLLKPHRSFFYHTVLLILYRNLPKGIALL